MNEINDLIAQRQQKDRFFKSNPYSPLSPQQQQQFDHLAYFDPNPTLAFELVPEEFAEKKNILMQTSTGDTRYYVRWGKVKFQMDGEDVELTLFYMPGQAQFFVPFIDATSGNETYGAGRYIDVDRLPDGTVRIDFNLAYSPYCAYSPDWNCPMPPQENCLKVAIRAGEKQPTGEWVIKAQE
jgi:uncharacterized protein